MWRSHAATAVLAVFGGYAIDATPVATANVSVMAIRYAASPIEFIIVRSGSALLHRSGQRLVDPVFSHQFLNARHGLDGLREVA